MPQPPILIDEPLQSWDPAGRADGPDYVQVFFWRGIRFTHMEWRNLTGYRRRAVTVAGITPKLIEIKDPSSQNPQEVASG